MHPLILQAVKEVETLRGLAIVSPFERMSRAYAFLLKCDAGMRANPHDREVFYECELYFDRGFSLLQEMGIVPKGE